MKWKTEKATLGFHMYQKYSKFWSISLGHFIKHKPLFSEGCSINLLGQLCMLHFCVWWFTRSKHCLPPYWAFWALDLRLWRYPIPQDLEHDDHEPQLYHLQSPVRKQNYNKKNSNIALQADGIPKLNFFWP